MFQIVRYKTFSIFNLISPAPPSLQLSENMKYIPTVLATSAIALLVTAPIVLGTPFTGSLTTRGRVEGCWLGCHPLESIDCASNDMTTIGQGTCWTCCALPSAYLA
ncbi:hypothetical protein P691DRAFT_812769 [Macrolepiota fuliginosa MF-IS2]|uniref:Uncharacterized protein n=1 Tax=Macrolepiota fuliginosa MF-IS2 TaxID=1400762 RepID=A0A9P6C5C7_9AGAR|nr:hypothetical protein P691DRAFT_812769 [Macrolepiota fuliginosa MF-IS2]